MSTVIILNDSKASRFVANDNETTFSEIDFLSRGLLLPPTFM